MRRTFKIIGFIIAFFISSIVILAFLVDANMFKPRIQALAQQQGIALTMRGDLHWAFWPAVGIAVQDVSAADVDSPEQIIAQVQKASFLMAFIPLMRGDFQVKHVSVEQATIDLVIDEQGVGNWEKLLKSKEKAKTIPAVKTSAEVSSEDLQLSIEKISLKKSTINYLNNQKGQRLALKDIDLDVSDVNFKGDPFAMTFAGIVEFSQTKTNSAPLVVKGKLSQKVSLEQNANKVTLDKGELTLEAGAKSAQTLSLTYSLELNNVKANPAYKGKLSIAAFDARKMLEQLDIHLKMADEKALSNVSFSGNFSGSKTNIAFDSVAIKIDKTQGKGNFSVTDFATTAVAANLQFDDINIDNYLSPKADSKAPPQNIATGNEQLLPLETLRKINADIKISLNKIIISELTAEKIQFDVDAKNGLLQQQLNASAYSGNVHVKTSLDARGQAAQIRFESILQGLDVAPILKDKKLDKSINLSGAIQANASGQTSGLTKNQFMDSLAANANFSGAKMRMAPLNIEQQFCKLITLVNKSEEPAKTWETYTELRELSGKITIAKRIITIDSLNAGVEKLTLGAGGNINLVNGTYDFMLPLKLNRDASDTPTSITTSKDGCTVYSNYWAERSMSLLRCRGAYAQIDPKQDCRPDKDALIALTKEYAEYKLREKYGEKIDSKKAELQKKLNDKLGEGGSEKAKNLLKNLFKKNNDK